MTNEIKLTEAQIRALRTISDYGRVRPTNHWHLPGVDEARRNSFKEARVPTNTLRTLEDKGLAQQINKFCFTLTTAGRQWLQDAGYLDVGGGGTSEPDDMPSEAYQDGYKAVTAMPHMIPGGSECPYTNVADIDDWQAGRLAAINAIQENGGYRPGDIRSEDLQKSTNALDEPVSTLATVQATYISAKEKLDMYMAADPELAKLRDAASDAKNAVDMARQRVITKALEAFAANPDERQVHPNVEIKMMTVLGYESDAAIRWSYYNAPRLVKLDAKGFESLIKARKEEDTPAFVTRSKEPKPHIDRDLNGNS